MRHGVLAVLAALLLVGCSPFLERIGASSARHAKLPVPTCPTDTLTLDEGWRDEGARVSLGTGDRRALDEWIIAWQDCARKRGAVIEEANR